MCFFHNIGDSPQEECVCTYDGEPSKILKKGCCMETKTKIYDTRNLVQYEAKAEDNGIQQ